MCNGGINMAISYNGIVMCNSVMAAMAYLIMASQSSWRRRESSSAGGIGVS